MNELASMQDIHYSPREMEQLFSNLVEIPIYPDGRPSLYELYREHYKLKTVYGFKQEVIYLIDIDGKDKPVTVPIFSYVSPQPEGQESLCIMTGIHGEEPAPPTALAKQVPMLGKLGQNVAMAVMGMMNGVGYYRNWRFHDMQFSLERRNVTDSRHLLPNVVDRMKPMLASPHSPISDLVTTYFLNFNKRYPILFFYDPHEDAKLLKAYIYSQGKLVEVDPIALRCAQILEASGLPLEMDGKTRFPGEVIRNGLVFAETGGPVEDGSIDQLACAKFIYRSGLWVPNHAAFTGVVPETPAHPSIPYEKRVDAHENIFKEIPILWQMALALRT